MKDRMILQTPKQLKAFSHPLRIGILNLISTEALTNEDLAKKLGVASGALHFHTKFLVDAGLIEIVETRQLGPQIEKLYRAVARNFDFNSTLSKTTFPPFEPLIKNALQTYQRCWEASEGKMNNIHIGFTYNVKMPAAKIREFGRKFSDLLKEFEAASNSDQDGDYAALLFVYHDLPASD